MVAPRTVQLAAHRFEARLPRRTVRLRLTLIYGSLFIACGAALLTITYVLVAHNQNYISRPDPGLPPGPTGAGQNFLRDAGRTLALVRSSQHVADLHALVIPSAVALAIMAVVSMWLGWLTAGRVLRPLRTITTAARDISATNLHERLALAGPDDELKELADTFDGLLGRLQTSFQSRRQFVANASHELRTPLARLKTLAQVALADPDASQRSLRFAHERVLASEQQLERLIDSLLTLASGERALDHPEALDLAALTGEALRSRAEATCKRTPRSGERTEGNRQLLERLAENLIDNAIRHNTRSGHIDVTTGATAGHAVLSVSNSGPVIPETELERLQQPFQRFAVDRTSRGEGFGLGLSIVHAIATAHHASVVTESQANGGLQIEVLFPANAHTTAASVCTTRVATTKRGRHPAATPCTREAEPVPPNPTHLAIVYTLVQSAVASRGGPWRGESSTRAVPPVVPCSSPRARLAGGRSPILPPARAHPRRSALTASPMVASTCAAPRRW